jgi:carbon storage regulator
VLVLARRLDEVICIGDNIRIKVVAMQPGMVKLGIDAPDNVVIMRKELLPEGKLDLNAQRPKMGQRAPEPR